MRILLFGKNGQVGWELQRTLAPLGEVVALGRQEADLGDFDRLREVVWENKPEVIVNAAAYTDVDGAESNQELAMRINGEAPGVLAEEAKKLGALLVHYSTDYVFDGEKGEPYVEVDAANPINFYGESKLAGESAIQLSVDTHLILRTSWVYCLRRNNFLTKVMKWSSEKDVIKIVEDQVGSPTWARLIAEITALILERSFRRLEDLCGIYHVAGKGQATRFEWAKAILLHDHHANNHLSLFPAQTKDFPAVADRPRFTALDSTKIERKFNLRLPDWREALALAMEPISK